VGKKDEIEWKFSGEMRRKEEYFKHAGALYTSNGVSPGWSQEG
jgi:hypothetical protein